MTKKKKVTAIISISVLIIAIISLTLIACTMDNNTSEPDTNKLAVSTATEKVTEKATEKPTEKETEKATEKSSEKSTEKTTEKTSEKATEKSTSNDKDNKNSSTTTTNNGGQTTYYTTTVDNNSGSNGDSTNNSTSPNHSSTSNNNSQSSNNNSNNSSSNTSNNKTWHEAEYKTVHHPAETKKVWVVDQEGYTYEEPVYEELPLTICYTCGAEITGNTSSHGKSHMLVGENFSYGIETRTTQTGTKTITVEEQGHWETQVVKEAWDEQVIIREAGYY